MVDHMQSLEDAKHPKYAQLPVWQRISGLGRSKSYEMLGTGELRGIKVGRRLLIDIEAGLAALAAMPTARIHPPVRRRR
jgi:hypothetical protein